MTYFFLGIPIWLESLLKTDYWDKSNSFKVAFSLDFIPIPSSQKSC